MVVGWGLFAGFAGQGACYGLGEVGEFWLGWDYIGGGGGGCAWQEILGWIGDGGEDFGVRGGGAVQAGVVVEHAARQHGFRGFFDPLIHQDGDFAAEIGGVVKVSQFKTLQAGTRCGVEVLQGRNHAQFSQCRASRAGGLDC